MKKILFGVFSLMCLGAHSQVIQLSTSTFENGETPLYDQSGTVNSWRTNSCAGNGTSQPGTTALYVSKGGVTPGCGATGQDQYAYAAAPPSTVQRITAFSPVDGKCTNTHTIQLDYKFNPTSTNTYAYIVYSLDGGAFWYKQDTLQKATNWTTITLTLSEDTDNTDFLVGFRFEYNDEVATGDPLAIDNIVLTGKSSTATIDAATQALCGATTTTLVADPNYAGSGVWTYGGQGTISASFTNSSSSNPGVNNLGYGTFPFVWTVTSANCGTTTDTIFVTNSEPPSNANIQDTVFACVQNVLSISTSTPTAGTGMWSATSGATFADASSPVTTLTNLPTGWSQVVWTISNPGCPSKSDTMNVYKSNGKMILSSDTTICFESNPTVHVVATPVDSTQQFNWSFYTGSGDILTPTETSTDITNLAIGENKIVYTVDHLLCPTEKDTITINIVPCEDFKPQFPTILTPNGDGKNDVFVIYNLESLYPNCDMIIYNRWGNVVFESVGYQEPWDGTFKGEKLPIGAYFFKLNLNDNENTSYKGTINIIH